MGIFDRFPYSSTHEMNLDFMLGKATEIAESLQEVQDGLSDIDTHKAQAEQAAQDAAQARQAAQSAAQAASASAGQAAQHKTDAEDAADRAEAASDLADEAVEQAQTAAQNASTAADGAIASATAAESRINAAAAQAQTNVQAAANSAAASAAAAESRINTLAESLPEDFTELNNEVTNLKSAVKQQQSDIYGLPYPVFTKKGIIIAATGALQTGNDATVQYSDYVPIPDGAETITSTMRIGYPTAIAGSAFYDSAKNFISGVREDYSATAWGYNVRQYPIPSGAKYVRFTYYSDESTVEHPDFYAYTNIGIKEQTAETAHLNTEFNEITKIVIPDYDMSALTGRNSDTNNIYANTGYQPGKYIGFTAKTTGGIPIEVYKYNTSDFTFALIATFTPTSTGFNTFYFESPVTLEEGYGFGLKAEQVYVSGYVHAGETVQSYNVTTRTLMNALMLNSFIRQVENLVELEDKVNAITPHVPISRTFSVIGDSISTYAGKIPSGYATFYPASDVISADYMWWNILAKETGLTMLRDASWSGSGLQGSRTGTAVIGCSQARCNDLGIWENGQLITAPDIIIAYFGINEFYRSLGDYTAKTPMPEQDVLGTFSEAYAVMLQNIKNTYPNAIVFCSTLIPRYKNESDENAPYDFPNLNGQGKTIEDYNTIIVALARAFSCEVIYMSDANINRFNAETYLIDYLHPNKAGQERMGQVMAKYVKACLDAEY